MRKIWPSEDNCSRLVRNSHNTRTTLAQPMRGANFPLFLHARTTDFPDIFSLIFSRVNSFSNLVFSRHKALSCNFSIYRGAQRLQKIWDDWGIDPLYINLEIYKALFFSSPVLPHFYFLRSQTASEGFSSKDDWLKLLVSQSMDVM